MEKSNSITSIGFGVETDTPIDSIQVYNDYLYDICAFAIECPHKQMPVLIIQNGSALWLPYVRLHCDQKWLKSVETMSEMIRKDRIESLQNDSNGTQTKKVVIESIVFNSISKLELLQKELVSRIIFRAQWNSSEGMVCCKDTNLFKWYPISDIINSKVDKLWGSEVLEMAIVLSKKVEDLIDENLLSRELTAEEYLKYDTTDEKSISYSDNENSDQNNCISLKSAKEFVQKTGIDANVLKKFYSDFIQHCYPAFNMSFTSYQKYIEKMDLIKMEDKVIRRGFVAMNSSQSKYLCFEELLLGLTALDMNSPEGQIRNAFIFRYYDSNSDGFLERNDFENMLIDVKNKQNKPIDMNSVGEEVDKIVDLSNQRMNYELFIKSKVIKTSIMCRSIELLYKLILNKNIYELIDRHSKSLIQSREVSGNCPKCKVKNYKLAVHSLKMDSNGRLCSSKNEIYGYVWNKVEDELMASNQRHSMSTMQNEKSVANQVLKLIQDFAKVLKSDANDKTKLEKQLMTSKYLNFEVIKDICEEVINIFRCEPRVVRVQSPVYVLGDIHGNIEDLTTFEEQLWRTAPQCMPTNLLFTGDYVDRGKYGIECVLYLYCLKILNPNQVFLLRGNHEIRIIQKQFTFEAECKHKYHLKDGQKVFEILNNTFDVLPIAGVVDERIFCAHGGIPHSLTTIDELMSIPTPLKNPENESPAAWEILWSDPIEEEEYKQQQVFTHETENSGFLQNLKRSTAFYFSQRAVDHFLAFNQLSHIIRAHEVVPEGYELHMNGKVLTIFSCSRYCGQTNKAATVQINGTGSNGTINIIQLQT